MKKSEYFILTPSYQNDQKDTTVWPTQKKYQPKNLIKPAQKTCTKINTEFHEIIEKTEQGIT